MDNENIVSAWSADRALWIKSVAKPWVEYRVIGWALVETEVTPPTYKVEVRPLIWEDEKGVRALPGPFSDWTIFSGE